MDDLISRQAAIDSPVKMVSEGLEWIPVYHIKELPSAEPEIIRCKDCKHHVLHPRMGVLWCTMLHSDMGYNQFCSYAERRGEEE